VEGERDSEKDSFPVILYPGLVLGTVLQTKDRGLLCH